MEASSLIALWDGAAVPIPLYTHYPAAGGRTQRTLKGDTGANAAGVRDRDARDTQKNISF
jgi:hypothetical protein